MYIFACVHLLWYGRVHVELTEFVCPRNDTQISRLGDKYVYLLSQLTSLNVLQYRKTKIQPVTNMEFTLKTQQELELSNKRNLCSKENKAKTRETQHSL